MARIIDPRLYGLVSHDILSRKVYPFVIDKMAIDAKSNYKYKILSTYIDKSAVISMSTNVSDNCVVGRKTEIDSNGQIYQSIIGANCKIGKKVEITNSIIDADIKIEDNCII